MRRALRAMGVVLAVVSGYWLVRRVTRRQEGSTVVVEIRVTPKSQAPPEPEISAPPAPRPPPMLVEPSAEPPRPRDMRAPALVALAIAAIALAVWVAEIHPRTDARAVQQHVAVFHPGTTVGCLQRSSNASQFSCAVTQAAGSQCLAVSVSVLGHVSTGRDAPGACDAPQLTALLPHPVTALGVASDVTAIVGGSRFICARMTAGGERFACARRSASGLDCRVALVRPWVGLRPHPAGRACRAVRALRETVIG